MVFLSVIEVYTASTDLNMWQENHVMGVLIMICFAAGCIFVARFVEYLCMIILGATEAKRIEFSKERMDGGEYVRKELFALIRDDAPKEQIKAKEEEIRQLFVDRKSRWNLALAVNLSPTLGSMAAISMAFFCMNWLDLSAIMGLDRLWIALGFVVMFMVLKSVNAGFGKSDQKILDAKRVTADV